MKRFYHKVMEVEAIGISCAKRQRFSQERGLMVKK
jgi:hypothetical protein